MAELLERISSRELTEWMQFAKVEPFGSEASYIGHAITAQTVANVNRKKGSKPFKLRDFMPQFEREEQSVGQMVQMAEMLTAVMGGEDKRSDQSNGE